MANIIVISLTEQSGRRIVPGANEGSPHCVHYNSTTMIPLIITGAKLVDSMIQLGTTGSDITGKQSTELCVRGATMGQEQPGLLGRRSISLI